MTLIAESHAFLHQEGGAEKAMRFGVGHHGRYDLLAMPNVGMLLEHTYQSELVRGDLRAAVGLHGVERSYVMSSTAPHRLVVAALEKGDFGKRVRFNGQTIPLQPLGADTLVLTCMDWRIHGSKGGLAEAIESAYGVDRFALMTIAGAAKDVTHVEDRSSFVLAQLAAVRREVRRVIALSHTDCGKYGGRKAFQADHEERTALTMDLERTARLLRNRFEALSVDIGIIQTGATSVEGIFSLHR